MAANYKQELTFWLLLLRAMRQKRILAPIRIGNDQRKVELYRR
jgi:hypothetical protein